MSDVRKIVSKGVYGFTTYDGRKTLLHTFDDVSVAVGIRENIIHNDNMENVDVSGVITGLHFTEATKEDEDDQDTDTRDTTGTVVDLFKGKK